MSRSRKIACTLAALVLVAVLLAWCTWSTEPEYQGIRASRWVAKYCVVFGNASVASGEMHEAFRAMGTNGVRYLADLAARPDVDPLFSRIEDELWHEMGGPLTKRMQAYFEDRLMGINPRRRRPYLSEQTVRGAATDLLQTLRPDAAVLLDALADRLKSADDGLRIRALLVLPVAATHRELIEPVLAHALEVEKDGIRSALLSNMGQSLWSSATMATVAICREQVDVDPTDANFSNRGKSPRWFNVALPELHRRLERAKDFPTRFTIAKAMCRIAPEPAGVAVLVYGMSQPGSRAEILTYVSSIPSTPELLTGVLKNDRPDGHWKKLLAKVALEHQVRGNLAAEITAPFKVTLVSSDQDARLVAAFFLQCDRNSRDEATAVLVNLARSENLSTATNAIHALMESDCAAAIPELKKLRIAAPPSLHSIIESALKCLEK